jgi:hypothetical protein
MKKIIFIIIFEILLLNHGYAQNQVMVKIVIPENPATTLVKMKTTQTPYHAFSKIIYTAEHADNSLFLFNDQPVLKLNKTLKLPVLLLTELSFSDVLENSMNNLKANLISTYDDHITELFKDAPSLVKLRFILPL